MIFCAHVVFLFVFDDENQNLFPMKELSIVWSKDNGQEASEDEFRLIKEQANRLFGEKRGVFDRRPGQWECQGVRRNMSYSPASYDEADNQRRFSQIRSGASLFWHDIEFYQEEDLKKFTQGQMVKVPFFD